MARKPTQRPDTAPPSGSGTPSPDGAREAAEAAPAAQAPAPDAPLPHEGKAHTAPEAVGGDENGMDAVPPDEGAPDDAGAGAGAPEDAGAGEGAPDDSTPEDAGADADTPETEAADTAPPYADTPEAKAADTAVPEADTTPTAPPHAPPTPSPAGAVTIRRGPGVTARVLALILGGMLAAAIGFGAARFVVPEGWPFGPVSRATHELSAALNAQNGRLAALETALAEVRVTADTARVAADEAAAAATRADDLGAHLDALSATLAEAATAASAARAALAERLTALERRPAPDGATTARAVASFEAEVAELRALVDADRARVAAEAEAARAAAAEAEAAARARAVEAARAAARAQLAAAIDAGSPLAPALDALVAAGIEVPAGLDAARAGVATLEGLQDGFAAAARAALSTRIDAPPAPGAGLLARFTAFLRAQFGVRSLAPRDGDSLDAVLSRAEASLRAGALGRALAEIETLPEPARAAMGAWITAATARHAAQGAAAALAPN